MTTAPEPMLADQVSDSTAAAPTTSPATPTQAQEETPTVSSIFANAKLNTNRSLQPIPGADKKAVEYLLLEDHAPNTLPGSEPGALPSRGWTDDLCYGTGTMYVSALALGGLWGFMEGMRHPEGKTFKLRVNGILNACTRRGPFLGNSVGVLTMLYNCTGALIGSVRGRHDAYNSMGAAAISGALFKSSAGLKPALLAAGLCVSAAGVWNLNREKVHNLRRSIVSHAGIGHYA
ncbi:Mitochondrial import inner membrane translocase subunit tim23 [Dimargaris verticillata]|uniref:Mitochondrial import inner membrane translocase subunit tim23 n=1 Tax=Dimargaris verticillata TaxID=2761393 RepID=A0A9W8B326_9FUNG|nr:Mitochondrial import inner membrane translocase subunit tim23 [Dimargaris verticillata]